MNIFQSLQQGDSKTWTDDAISIDNTLYNSTGYSLRYELRSTSGSPVTLNATASGSGWKTTLPSSVSANMTPGTWWFAAYLIASGERITAGQGEIVITPDLSQATNYDGRTVAEKALADAEAAMAAYKSSGGRVKQYTIGTRSMTFQDSAAILQEINYWKIKVRNEQTAKNIANGLGNPSRLYVRFGR